MVDTSLQNCSLDVTSHYRQENVLFPHFSAKFCSNCTNCNCLARARWSELYDLTWWAAVKWTLSWHMLYFFFILLLPTSKWYYLHVFQPPLDICIYNIDDPILNSLILVEFSSWDSPLEETTMVTYMMIVTVWKRNKWLYEMVILVSKVKISWAF